MKRTTLKHRRVLRPDVLIQTSDAQWPAQLERRKRPRTPLHFRRLELKYVIPERLLQQVIEDISLWTKPDPFLARQPDSPTSYPVSSIYFDSSDLHALHEKEDGTLHRRKVRLRTYAQEFSGTASCFIEIKRRVDFVVIKDRISVPAGALRPDHSVHDLLRDVLASASGDATTSEAEMLTAWYSLVPTAFVRYRRFPFVAVDDPNTRLTIDVDLEGKWRPYRIHPIGPLGRLSSHIPSGSDGISGPYGLLELKCNHAIPPWFHRLVQDLNLRRAAYSKYVLAVLALKPDLLPTTSLIGAGAASL